MDLGTAAQWSGVLMAVISLVVSVNAARSARNKAEIEGLASSQRAFEARLSKAENELLHMPDKDTAHRMEMAIQRLEGRLEVMDERLKPVAAIASRMQDVLLEGGAR